MFKNTVLRELFFSEEEEEWENSEYGTMNTLMWYSPHENIFSGNEIKKEKMARACGLHGGEVHKVIWREILKE